MNKNVTICVLVLLILLVGVAYAEEQEHASVNAAVKAIENIYRLFLKMTLPSSLDQYYINSTPEVVGNDYLVEMFKMAGMMQVIAEEMQARDFTSSKNTFNAFSIQYNNVSKMVPEWKKYFDKKLVVQLGKDIDENNVSKTLTDLGKLGENVCAKCHRNNKPQVWAKYYWKDFRTVNVSTPAGNMSWPAAKAIFVASSFDGATINLAEGRRDAANQSAERFTSMFSNVTKACDSCHTTERKYFVSADVIDLVNQYEARIKAGDLENAQILQGQIGEQCMRCHITHEGQQRMKEMMD
ncbi:MAG: multiheme c-type cytochrome [Candidatus Methanoperedens sp.]|nr:multiheme c-type cytochrome [Candidatus Methanoperedens sp.]